jgi:hypothetical protein
MTPWLRTGTSSSVAERTHQHRSFRFDASDSGGHVTVTVRAGTQDHDRALLGHLTMDPWEWVVLSVILGRGAKAAESLGEPTVQIVEHRQTEAVAPSASETRPSGALGGASPKTNNSPDLARPGSGKGPAVQGQKEG